MLSHPEFLADPWIYVRPDGESLAMVHARVGRFLQTLTRDSVIVAHVLSVGMIRAHYLGLSPENTMDHHMPNAGIMRLSNCSEAYFN